MKTFFQAFNQTQQFLILQGYADEILSEAELMSFLLQKTTDERFVIIVAKGLYLVEPTLSLADFSNKFISRELINVSQDDLLVRLQLPTEEVVLPLSDTAEAKKLLEDIHFLFSQPSTD